MKQLFFDIDSAEEIENLKECLLLLLNMSDIPTPKVIISGVPDWFVRSSD